MSFENFSNNSADKFDKVDSSPEAALMPRERERKLSEELKEVMVSVGTEYSYNEQFFVRGGYYYENVMIS